MIVAIDKKTINKIDDFNEFEFIYVFKDEPLKDLLKTNLHCICLDRIYEVDINLTEYNIPCLKKANVKDKDWKKPIEKPNYKYGIIIPNYNNNRGNYRGKTYLQHCIESVLEQTYTNYEIIFIDDMSTDNSVELVKSYNDKRIHIIENNRKRYNGGSRNVGIDKAKELKVDYICFIDSDDWWINNKVLERINRKMYGQEMMVLGCEMLFPNEKRTQHLNKFDTYYDIFFCINKVWCTCWSKVIRIDKIVYFCENTLMEDRVWTYRQADKIDFKNIIHLNEIAYVWNRLNTDNSVSMVRGNIWNASAWCHIGHQLQLLQELKHEEMKPILEKRIQECISKVKQKKYEQY